ncbi:hypothetical protein MTO96_024726 [Rhipicephalus appendiculatus]
MAAARPPPHFHHLKLPRFSFCFFEPWGDCLTLGLFRPAGASLVMREARRNGGPPSAASCSEVRDLGRQRAAPVVPLEVRPAASGQQ